MSKLELLKEEACDQKWRGQAQLEALNLAEIVGKPDENGKRIDEHFLGETYVLTQPLCETGGLKLCHGVRPQLGFVYLGIHSGLLL